MLRAACLPWPTPDGDGALGGHHVAAGEDALVAGHHALIDPHHAVLDLKARHPAQQRQVGFLAQRQHERVGLKLRQLAGGLGKAGLVELHLLQQHPAFAGVPDRGEPLHHHALFEGFLDLGVVRGHALARAAVHDDRLLGAQALGGASGVHRRVAAPVDDDAPAKQRALLSLHAAQQRDGVENVGRLAGGDVRAFADVRADGQERGVEAAIAHRVQDVRDLGVALQRDTEVEDALDLGVEHVARQAVLGYAEAHHPAGHRARVTDRDGMPATR